MQTLHVQMHPSSHEYLASLQSGYADEFLVGRDSIAVVSNFVFTIFSSAKGSSRVYKKMNRENVSICG